MYVPVSRPSASADRSLLQNFFSDLETCDQAITLACLRVLYDFVYTPLAPQKNTIGVGKGRHNLTLSSRTLIRLTLQSNIPRNRTMRPTLTSSSRTTLRARSASARSSSPSTEVRCSYCLLSITYSK